MERLQWTPAQYWERRGGELMCNYLQREIAKCRNRVRYFILGFLIIYLGVLNNFSQFTWGSQIPVFL